MELTDFQQKFTDLTENIEISFWEPLCDHTSFRIGGGAEVMAFPKTVEELSRLMKAAGELGCERRILGAGTNVLAPDEGLPGLTICLKDCLDGMELLDHGCIRVMAGVTMTRAAVFAANHGLSGLEFAHGIPGTVGGGVYMNAGAYEHEIREVCRSVAVMDRSGGIREIPAEEMEFSYRASRLQREGGIAVSAVFALTPADPEGIRKTMKEWMTRRAASQPLELPSAGSAFKRPAGHYAGALIDGAGLRGFQVGGAAVSTKHAGFVVNLGGATARDVRTLLAEVTNRVFEKSGVRLEPEVRIW